VGILKIEPILQYITLRNSYDSLSTNWNSFDIVNFSNTKKLWRFQQNAIKSILVCLYLYFKKDKSNKQKFFKRYTKYGLSDELINQLALMISRDNRKIAIERYETKNGRIEFHNFINRLAIWMATGSGKSLVIVKLFEILYYLMELDEIPRKEILLLTYREDLINQLKDHVRQFNELSHERDFSIKLFNLRAYEKIKYDKVIPYTKELNIFYYRSDLFSEEQKTKKIDFRNYENDGNWYVVLDEAHKGTMKDSKLQLMYSLMSKNGFLFNFSATFTDIDDILTTVYNYNLERFINGGYGKHLFLASEEIRGFKFGDTYNEIEKQRIVLKSLILLTYIKKIQERVKSQFKFSYHSPLLLTLVNTIQLKIQKSISPDLTLFFKELEKVANKKYEEWIFYEQKQELIKSFCKKPFPFLIFEEIPIRLDEMILNSIKIEDILEYVFNGSTQSKIEAVFNPNNSKEVAFKLVSSDKYFALIKIGDAQKWIKENLLGEYEIIERFEDISIFEKIEERDELNILIGSRAFYEGWDSNRPNLIIYINIGTQKDSKKFVLQSIGRGVRIEPLKDKRKRLKYLESIDVDKQKFNAIELEIMALETLFIFGTKKDALKSVLETLQIYLKEDINNEDLIITASKPLETTHKSQKNLQKFPIFKIQLDMIKNYFQALKDKILIIAHNLTPEIYCLIKNSFENIDIYYEILPENPPLSSLTPIKIIIVELIQFFKKSIKLDKMIS